ncbi:MAG: pyrrolidone-carboxylate peptidase [Candidatus Azotimanducaceae bacterium]|jgi:pyrrolidone-carboxylate peptidase
MNEGNVPLTTAIDISVELSRLAQAREALGDLLSKVQWVPPVPAGIDTKAWGRNLWHDETSIERPDDRRLYWRRLAALSALHQRGTKPADIAAFEAGSRGLFDLEFDPDARRKVLVTGFDPFHLETHIHQSNPSGAAVFQLHQGRDKQLAAGVDIRTAIFPVRYADFDHHLVERMLTPLLDELSMVITVSMGRQGFDLERFPGLRRSVTTPDNLNRLGGGSPEAPIVPSGLVGPEFVEFSLPVSMMRGVDGAYPVNDNRTITTLQAGAIECDSLARLTDQTAVFGSGGGYLSNEISYRALNTIRRAGMDIPAGHIHTPSVAGFDRLSISKISAQACLMILAAVEAS